MKRVLKSGLSVLLAFTIIFSSAYVGLSEVDFTGLFAIKTKAASVDDLTFTLNSDCESYTVTDCDTYEWGSLTIPATYNNKPVTSIGDNAFSGCYSLTSITIPDSVTSIGDGAFQGCYLTSINVDENNRCYSSDNGVLFDKAKTTLLQYPTGKNEAEYVIPGSVTSIGDRAFYYCANLTSITIPDSVTSIGDGAFQGCYLTSITIPDSVTSIGDGAFQGCYLTSITIPDSVTSIGDSAFSQCGSLTSITIPDSVTSIGDSAFSQCGSLTSITIPDSVTSIGDFAFNECYSLTTITIPDSVTSIGVGAFSLCGGLTSVVIGDGVTSIGSNAFQHCTGLASITIPDSVISIGAYAFYCCINLTTITIPDSVTSIGDGAFQECYLTSINVGENNRYYSSDNGVLFNEDKTALIQYPVCKNELEYVIPNSVTCISDSAFYNCVSLATIAIPDSVTSIGSSAFYNTGYYNNSSNWENGVLYIGNHLIRAETSITGDYVIKNGTKTIADSAFVSCRSLTSITIPDSVISIGAYAFYYCINLTSITIPDSVTSIGKGAFQECYLTEINVDENNRYYSSDNGVLFNEAKTTLIQYPAGKNEAEYVIPNSVTSIGDMAFYNCALTSITIPNSVTSIGDGTFYGCSHLNDVYYGSTQADWSKIAIGANNSHLTDATIHYHEHSYSVDWIVDSEATCIEDGYKHKICSLCGDVVTETILAKGHNYSTEWTVDVEPTDTAMGSKSRHCLNCDAKIDITPIPNTIVDDIMSVETNGILCNGEITYIIKLQAGVSVSGSVFGIIFDPNVLEPVEDKSGLCTKTDVYGNETQNYSGFYVTGMKYGTNNTFLIAHTDVKESVYNQDREYIKITFRVKDFSKTETGIDIYCTEFMGNPQVPKNEYTMLVSHFNESIYSYDHNISDEWIIDVAPTCTTEGSKSHHCLQCDVKFDVTAIASQGHSYSDWNVDIEPTCTEEGLQSKTCWGCGDVVTETIPTTGHSYSTEWTIDLEPTCTEDGSKSHHCSGCGDKKDITVITATGHFYSEWIVDTAPTCTEEGLQSKTCCSCGDVATETIPTTGHSYSTEWTIDLEPTCTEEGSKSHHCNVCGDKIDITPIDATGHSYGDWTVDIAPTCTEDGSQSKTCSACGDVIIEVIYTTGHDYSTEWTIDVAPTCEEEGSKSHHCNVCGDKMDVTTIEANGHSFSGEWIIDYEPTCTENGFRYRQCDFCDYVEEENISRNGHSYGEWVVIETNCLEDNYARRNCLDCNAVQTRYKDGRIILDPADICFWHESTGVYEVAISCIGASYIEVTFGEVSGAQDLFIYSDDNGTINDYTYNFAYSTIRFEGDSVLFAVASLFTSDYCIEIENVVAYTEPDESLDATGHDYVLQTNNNGHPHIKEYKCSHCGEIKTEKPVVSDCIECNFTITAIDSSSYKLVSFIGAETDVVIPATYNGRAVTTIANACFRNNKNIVTVKIREGITSIGSLAFMNCTSLERVFIPASITSIGTNAFYGFTGTIYCTRGSVAHEYAIANGINYVLLSIHETEDTKIDYENFIIRTSVQNCSGITGILQVDDNAMAIPVASYVQGNIEFYGTGTVVIVFNGNDHVGDFTLIVEGDTNGDSVCDVLDCFDVERASNGNVVLSGAYAMAADSNSDDMVDTADYQSIVNKALAS